MQNASIELYLEGRYYWEKGVLSNDLLDLIRISSVTIAAIAYRPEEPRTGFAKGDTKTMKVNQLQKLSRRWNLANRNNNEALSISFKIRPR